MVSYADAWLLLGMLKKRRDCIIINHNKLMTDRCTDNGFEEGQECYIKKILEKEKI